MNREPPRDLPGTRRADPPEEPTQAEMEAQLAALKERLAPGNWLRPEFLEPGLRKRSAVHGITAGTVLFGVLAVLGVGVLLHGDWIGWVYLAVAASLVRLIVGEVREWRRADAVARQRAQESAEVDRSDCGDKAWRAPRRPTGTSAPVEPPEDNRE